MIRILRLAYVVPLLLIFLVSVPKLYAHAVWNLGMHEFATFAIGDQVFSGVENLIATEQWFASIPETGLNAVAINRTKQVQRLRTRYTSSLFTENQQLNEYFASAKNTQNQGRIEEAITSYENIVTTSPDYIPAYYQLYSLYESIGRKIEAEHVSQQLATLEPKYVIDSTAEINGLSATGYQFDVFSLETLRSIPATVYWQASMPVCATNEITHWNSDQADLYCVNNRIFQVMNLVNLAGVGEDMRYFQTLGLLGYRSGSSREDLQEDDSHRFVYVDREGMSTVAFMLDNPRPMKNILISPDIKVEPDAHYLLSSWIRTDNGQPNAGLGVICFGKGYTDDQRHYIPIRGGAVQEWAHFANIIQVEETARTCRVLLMNYGDPDAVYFDDITFTRIDGPVLESR